MSLHMFNCKIVAIKMRSNVHQALCVINMLVIGLLSFAFVPVAHIVRHLSVHLHMSMLDASILAWLT